TLMLMMSSRKRHMNISLCSHIAFFVSSHVTDTDYILPLSLHDALPIYPLVRKEVSLMVSIGATLIIMISFASLIVAVIALTHLWIVYSYLSIFTMKLILFFDLMFVCFLHIKRRVFI